MKHLLFIVGLLVTFSNFSQNNKLKKIFELEKVIESEQFLDTILSLSFADKTNNSELFLELSKKANLIAIKLKDTLKIAQTNEALALSYHYTNKFDLAIENTIKAANLYYQLGDINKYGNSYVNLGWRINKRDLQKGIFYMMKGINILERKPEETSFFRIGAYNNYGVLKQRVFENDSALYYHKKSYDLCLKHNDSIGIPYVLVEMGIVYNNLNKPKKAEKFLEESLEIRKQIKDNYGIADSYENLGNFYLKNKEFKKAIENHKKALLIANKSSFNFMKKNVSEKLYAAYEELGEFTTAYRYLKLNKQLADSANNIQIENRIRQLQIQFETAEKEKELLKTRTEKAETELELSKTRGWIFVLVGGLLLAVILFFAINQRNKRKAQEEITQEKERGFKAIIDAQEEERSKIARELHDGVVQQIGSVILQSRNLFTEKEINTDSKAKELLESLENSNQDLRNISHQMMPRALKELGIIPALQDLLDGSLSYANITYSLEHFNLEQRLPEKVEVTIYRITQELINNIIKHSKATEVSVQLFKNDKNAILIVEDNGVGFTSSKNKKGIGLLNISSRLDIVNGDVNFEPSPNSGTLVTVKIPV